MLKTILNTILFTLLTISAIAQDSTSVSTPLEISGSVDTYFKYDLSSNKKGNINRYTFFDSDNNSVSIGMVDVILKKSIGKTSFFGELSYGPRGQYESLQSAADGNSFHIQNLFVNYQLTEKLSMTAGFMSTFVGYEVIAPTGNFNYSTSYLFGAGPFQDAGIKANYAFSDKVKLMVGLFNDWNTYKDMNGVSHIGAQLAITPVEGWTSYINVLSGRSAATDDLPGDQVLGSGTIIDLVSTYQITKEFKLGLNAADYTMPNDNAGGFSYSGVALYPQYSFSQSFALGLRGEYFKFKNYGEGADFVEGNNFKSLTVSGNYKIGGLTIIPEIRFDNSSNDIFFKRNEIDRAKSASQFSLAAVFAF